MITYLSSLSPNEVTKPENAPTQSEQDDLVTEYVTIAKQYGHFLPQLTTAIISSSTHPSRHGQEATEWEIDNLLHVVDDVPITVWMAALVGAAERFAWYGNTGPLRKFL